MKCARIDSSAAKIIGYAEVRRLFDRERPHSRFTHRTILGTAVFRGSEARGRGERSKLRAATISSMPAVWGDPPAGLKSTSACRAFWADCRRGANRVLFEWRITHEGLKGGKCTRE
jgi:hypothetical protein